MRRSRVTLVIGEFLYTRGFGEGAFGENELQSGGQIGVQFELDGDALDGFVMEKQVEAAAEMLDALEGEIAFFVFPELEDPFHKELEEKLFGKRKLLAFGGGALDRAAHHPVRTHGDEAGAGMESPHGVFGLQHGEMGVFGHGGNEGRVAAFLDLDTLDGQS